MGIFNAGDWYLYLPLGSLLPFTRDEELSSEACLVAMKSEQREAVIYKRVLGVFNPEQLFLKEARFYKEIFGEV